MKAKFSARLICLVVAVVALSGAVAFAAAMGSPYETFKRAALKAAAYTNSTMEFEGALWVNGVVEQRSKSYEVVSDYARLSYNYDDNGDYSGYHYSANGLSLSSYSHYTTEDGTDWMSAFVSPPSEHYTHHSGILGIRPDDLGSARMRFYELLIDALVGDLKNNVTMSGDNGVRTIQGTLTGSQLPEIAKAAIDMAVEQAGEYYWNRKEVGFDGSYYVYDNINIRSGVKTVTRWREPVRLMTAEEEYAMLYGDIWREFPDSVLYGFTQYEPDGPTYILEGPSEQVSEYTAAPTRADYADRGVMNTPMSDLTLDYVRGEAEIDADGNLLNISVRGAATVTTVFGDVMELLVEGTIRFTDIGTSSPSPPIPGAAQLLTYENIKALFGSEYVNVYFTLNENGTINESSLTTTYPGEWDRGISYSSGYSMDRSAISGALTVTQPPVVITEGVEPGGPIVLDPPPPFPDNEASGGAEDADDGANGGEGAGDDSVDDSLANE